MKEHTGLDWASAQRMARTYSCGRCHKSLTVVPEPNRLHKVVCKTCGEEVGFIKKDDLEIMKKEEKLFEADVEILAGVREKITSQEQEQIIKRIWG